MMSAVAALKVDAVTVVKPLLDLTKNCTECSIAVKFSSPARQVTMNEFYAVPNLVNDLILPGMSRLL